MAPGEVTAPHAAAALSSSVPGHGELSWPNVLLHDLIAVAQVLVPWLRAAALCYMIALVGAFLLVSALHMRLLRCGSKRQLQGGVTLPSGAKATPRVDVGDTPNTMVTASP